MLKNLVGGGPRSERAGKSPHAAARKLRAVVGSLEGRTMMSVAVMSVAVFGVVHRLIPIPAEATTVTSSRVPSNLASIKLDFDTPLLNKISDLLTRSGSDPQGQNLEGRKALLLNYALVTYESSGFGKMSKMTASELTNPSDYHIEQGKDPAYFTYKLPKINPPTGGSVTYASATHYDYNATGKPPQFWVDFANKDLGGGVFTDGFLQEEIMFLETPELANAAAQTPALTTRTGFNGPLNGSPTPLIFRGANRVMNINRELAVSPSQGPREKENWRTFSVADLIRDDVPLPKPQNINVLSMAAPYLKDPSGKADLSVVKDLFNTFVAGFTLAKEAFPSDNTILINTGPIGAGGFHNSPVVVNVMQQLAAIVVIQRTSTQVNLKFWAYYDAASQKKDKDADDADHDVGAIIKEFNAPGTSDKTISNLLVIATKQLNSGSAGRRPARRWGSGR